MKKPLLLLVPLMLFANPNGGEYNESEFNKSIDETFNRLKILLVKSGAMMKELAQDPAYQEFIDQSSHKANLYYKNIESNVSKTSNDMMIKSEIIYKLVRDKEIDSKNIMVLVNNGDVELYGKAPSRTLINKIFALAKAINDVKSVESFIIIKN